LLAEFAKLKGLTESDFEKFKNAYVNKDPDAVKIMDNFIKYISIGINNILNAYNPEIIVINSKFIINFPEVLEQVEASLSSKMNSYLKIVPSRLKDSSILMGGICVSIKSFLGIENLKLKQLSVY